MAETAKKTATKSAATNKAATKKTATKKTATNKAATNKAATKKAASKKTAARQRAGSPSTSTATRRASSTASSSAKPSSTSTAAARPGTERDSAAESPESIYLAAALDAATELSDEITAAGQELTDRLISLSGDVASPAPDDAIEALGRAAAANDVAEFLRSHHNFAEATLAVANGANNAYRGAVSDYAVRTADAWRANSDKVASLFNNYVNAVTGQLDLSDPSSIARVGWSLVAASQVAPSVTDAAASTSTTGAG